MTPRESVLPTVVKQAISSRMEIALSAPPTTAKSVITKVFVPNVSTTTDFGLLPTTTNWFVKLVTLTACPAKATEKPVLHALPDFIYYRILVKPGEPTVLL